MNRWVVALLASAAFTALGDQRIDAVTNHLAQLQATRDYAFSISFGPQGALRIDGFTMATARVFKIEVEDRELLRVAGSQMWMPAAGTNGATLISFDYPLIVGIGYDAGAASLAFGVMPLKMADPFLAANYAGLNAKVDSLPVVRPRKDGWIFSETNELGSCVEITDAKNPDRVEIALVKPAEDKSSVFIHSLRVTARDGASRAELPRAARTVALHDFSESLRFTSGIVSALQQSAMNGSNAEDVFIGFGHLLDIALGGTGFKPPSLPPLPPLNK